MGSGQSRGKGGKGEGRRAKREREGRERVEVLRRPIGWDLIPRQDEGPSNLMSHGGQDVYKSYAPSRPVPIRILCPIEARTLPNLMPHRGLPRVVNNLLVFALLL